MEADILGMKSSFRNHGLTQLECESEALFMFVAGSETAASVIRMTLFYIMATPRVYKKLKAEMKSAIEDGRASTPITSEEAKTLPYLQVGLLSFFNAGLGYMSAGTKSA
jgi:cytochrome P450